MTTKTERDDDIDPIYLHKQYSGKGNSVILCTNLMSYSSDDLLQRLTNPESMKLNFLI